MKRNQLKALGVSDEVIGDVLDALHEAIRNAETTVTNKLNGEIETLKTDLKAAKEENVSIIDKYKKDQDSYKVKYEAEVKAREEAEGKYKAEKETHEATVTGYKAEKETAAKNDAFINAVTGYEHTEKGKLNPKQADLLLATLGAKAEYTEKDGVYTVKNLNAIMDEAISHGGFDFAKSETRTADTGSFRTDGNMTVNPWLKEHRNLGAQMQICKEDPARATSLAAAAGIELKL